MRDKNYDEWFLYYRSCEKKLKKIHGIVTSKNFKDFHKENGESKLWDDVCDIFSISDIRNPEEYKEYLEDYLKKKYEEKLYGTSK